MYRLNSDSEGDEGSDINPQDEEEDSQSEEEAESDETALHTAAEGKDDCKAGARRSSSLEAGPSYSFDQGAHDTSQTAAQEGVNPSVGQNLPTLAGYGSGHPVSGGPGNSRTADSQQGHSLLVDVNAEATQVWRPVGYSEQCGAVEAGQPSSSTAEANTLAYGSPPVSPPCIAADATLPYDAVRGSQTFGTAEHTLSLNKAPLKASTSGIGDEDDKVPEELKPILSPYERPHGLGSKSTGGLPICSSTAGLLVA